MFWASLALLIVLTVVALSGPNDAAFVASKGQSGGIGIFKAESNGQKIEFDTLPSECETASDGTGALYIIFLLMAPVTILARFVAPVKEKLGTVLPILMAATFVVILIASIVAIATWTQCKNALEDDGSNVEFADGYFVNAAILAFAAFGLGFIKMAKDDVEGSA